MMAGLSLLLSSSIASAQDKAALSDYDKGVAAFNNGQFEEARVLYTKACNAGVSEGCYELGGLSNILAGSWRMLSNAPLPSPLRLMVLSQCAGMMMSVSTFFSPNG
jgi:hypothetical protein